MLVISIVQTISPFTHLSVIHFNSYIIFKHSTFEIEKRNKIASTLKLDTKKKLFEKPYILKYSFESSDSELKSLTWYHHLSEYIPFHLHDELLESCQPFKCL